MKGAAVEKIDMACAPGVVVTVVTLEALVLIRPLLPQIITPMPPSSAAAKRLEMKFRFNTTPSRVRLILTSIKDHRTLVL
jgi:hypothetical protein